MHVLLLGAEYYGTLAAARCFGRRGIRVVMADEDANARGLYSRFVGERLTHPPLARPAMFLEWLVAYGQRNPGTFLYPPNDHLAWLLAANADVLREYYTMYMPPEPVVFGLLDKKRLHDACAAVGIDVPETRAASEVTSSPLRFPVLLKPRTQTFLAGGIKGIVVDDPSALPAELARARQLLRFAPVLTEHHPEAAEPLVQEYLPVAETSIFSISGFVDREGSIVTRAAMKVLQRPRKVGIGLCFEGREIELELVDKIRALCKYVGYHGAFEAELIADRERRLLIDFNPRFYSQMGFDIARGLRLPLLVWHAARGEHERVAAELAYARAWRRDGAERYCHKSMLDLVLVLQGLSGQMSRAEVRRWRSWYRDHLPAVTDAVRDPDDRVPAVVDTARWVGHFARHPRSFVRSYVLNR